MAELTTKAPQRRDDLTEAEEALAEDQAPPSGPAQATKKASLPEFLVSEIAHITCQADLDDIVKAHQGWIASVFDPKAETVAGRANLKGADLRGYQLAGINLSGANLEGANLQGVEAIGINLTAANLRGALLQAANLRNARLTRAKIDGADLRGADLTGATLLGVDLNKAITKSPELPNKALHLEGATRLGPEGDEQWDEQTSSTTASDATLDFAQANSPQAQEL